MNIELTPCKRFGHPRLYVSVDGRQVGYRDLTTGTDHPEGSDDVVLLTALVDTHEAQSEQTTPDLEPKPHVAPTLPGDMLKLPEPVAVVMPVFETALALAVEETWTDLATNPRGTLPARRLRRRGRSAGRRGRYGLSWVGC